MKEIFLVLTQSGEWPGSSTGATIPFLKGSLSWLFFSSVDM